MVPSTVTVPRSTASRARERLANRPRWTSRSSSRWRVLAGRGEFIGLHGESRQRRQGHWDGRRTSSHAGEWVKPLRGLLESLWVRHNVREESRLLSELGGGTNADGNLPLWRNPLDPGRRSR